MGKTQREIWLERLEKRRAELLAADGLISNLSTALEEAIHARNNLLVTIRTLETKTQ